MFINNINPVLIQFDFITIHWYGLFLTAGILLAVLIIYKLFKQKNYSADLALDLCIWLIIGGLIGARLGEILFYEPTYYFSHPLEMIFINHGGLSSHGLALGLLITLLLFSKIKKMPLKQYLDILIIPIPLLATFIRIGNFFNSEIVGRQTDLPWGVYFLRFEENPILRHPTQLYEAIILLIIFNIQYLIFKKYQHRLPPLFIFNLFLLLYFGSRFLVEFTKECQTSWEEILTSGQWLSLPFIILGAVGMWKLKKQKTR